MTTMRGLYIGSFVKKIYKERTDKNSMKISPKVEVKMANVSIQRDRVIEATRPCIAVDEKREEKCMIIDITAAGDSRTRIKEPKDFEKYQNTRNC